MAEHNTSRRTARLLEELIPKYDNDLARRMIMEAACMKDQIPMYCMPKCYTILKHSSNTAFFEIELKGTVVQYVPECFRFLKRNIYYPYRNGARLLEHMPCYIPNLNHVVMYTSWDSNSEFRDISGGLLEQYEHNSTPMMFYSTNILLRNKASLSLLDESLHDHFRRCFEYSYWRLPSLDQAQTPSVNNLIYATGCKVKQICVMKKTLVKIEEIYTRVEFCDIAGKNEKCRAAKVSLLSDGRQSLNSQETKRILIPECLATQLRGFDIINGIVIQSGTGPKRFLDILIGQIGDKVEPACISAIVSLILMRKLQNIDDLHSLTKITPIDELQAELLNLFQSNPLFFDSIFHWEKDISKKISKSLASLWPLFLEDGGYVYHLPPAVAVFFLTKSPPLLDNKEMLLSVIRLLNNIDLKPNYAGDMSKLRRSEFFEKVKRISPDLLCQKSISKLRRDIAYSIVLSNPYGATAEKICKI